MPYPDKVFSQNVHGNRPKNALRFREGTEKVSLKTGDKKGVEI